MIALMRRLMPARRPNAAEITRAWQHTRLRPLRLPDLGAAMADGIAAFGDPGVDPIGTNRWASPLDAYPWVKTDYDRWIHIGGFAVQSDRQVVGYQPGLERRVAPRSWRCP